MTTPPSTNRALASSSIMVLGGMILRQVGLIVAFSILSRRLTQGTYGQFQRVWMIGLAVSTVLAMGLPLSMQFFLPQIASIRQRRRSFLQSLMLLQLCGLVAGGIMYQFANPISYIFCGDHSVAPLLRSYWPVVVFLGFWSRVPAVFNSIERPRLAGVMAMLYGVIVAGTLGGSAFFTLELEYLFAIQATALGVGWLGAAAIGLWCISDCPEAALRHTGPDDNGHWDQGVSVRRQMLYALPLLGSTLVGTMSILVDKMLVSNRFDSEDFALYANGAFEVPIGTLLVAAVFGVLMPKMARELGNDNVKEAVRLNRMAVQNISIIVYPSAVFLAVFSREVMVSLFGPTYATSGWVFMVYALAMLSVLYNPLGLISITGKTRLNLYLSLAALGMNIALSWLGIVLFGMIGACLGCCTYRFTINLLFARVAAGAMGTTFGRLLPWRDLGRTLLVCLIPAAASAPVMLLPIPSPARLLLGAAVFGATYMFAGTKAGLLNAAHAEILLSMTRRLWKR